MYPQKVAAFGNRVLGWIIFFTLQELPEVANNGCGNTVNKIDCLWTNIFKRKRKKKRKEKKNKSKRIKMCLKKWLQQRLERELSTAS